MTKTEARETAKRLLCDSIAVAYYKLEDYEFEGLSEEETDLINEYIHKYGETMAKSIGRRFYTF